MPVGQSLAITLTGLTAHLVTVQADISQGLPGFAWSGLPDSALREAQTRVRSAITNAHESWPQSKITVGLSPATVRKTGSGLDLSVALAILAAAGTIPPFAVRELVAIGELRVDGTLEGVTGVLPAVIGAAQRASSMWWLLAPTLPRRAWCRTSR